MIKGGGKTRRDSQQSPGVIRAGPKRARGEEGARARHAEELLLMAAHDLRNPLAAIKMRAQLIEHRSRRGEELSALELATVFQQISVAADYAFELVDDLLSIERLPGPRRVEGRESEVDIEAIIAEALARHEESLETAHCKVTLTRDTRLRRPSGAWDRGYLLTVFSNLLRNVVRHAPGAPIHIALVPRGDRLGIVFSTADRVSRRKRDCHRQARSAPLATVAIATGLACGSSAGPSRN
jgi:signal transduction histidine kinase